TRHGVLQRRIAVIEKAARLGIGFDSTFQAGHQARLPGKEAAELVGTGFKDLVELLAIKLERAIAFGGDAQVRQNTQFTVSRAAQLTTHRIHETPHGGIAYQGASRRLIIAAATRRYLGQRAYRAYQFVVGTNELG